MLTLAQGQAAVAAALAEAARRGAEPLGVILLDAGAHPVVFARQDGASLFRHDIARAKAAGALGMGADTRALAERAEANPAFFQSLAVVADGRLALSAGGVLIRDAAGAVLGAIGVSGDKPDADEAVAFAGRDAIIQGDHS